MVLIDKDNKKYIGTKFSKYIFSIDEQRVVENIKELDLEQSSLATNKLDSFTEIFGRLCRVLEIMSKTEKNVPLIYGRVLEGDKDKIPLIKKEFVVFNMDKLETSVGKLYGNCLIEMIILNTEQVSIQEVMEFCSHNKARMNIFHFSEIEDNEIYLSSKVIKRIYIPNLISKDIIGPIERSNKRERNNNEEQKEVN